MLELLEDERARTLARDEPVAGPIERPQNLLHQFRQPDYGRGASRGGLFHDFDYSADHEHDDIDDQFH